MRFGVIPLLRWRGPRRTNSPQRRRGHQRPVTGF